jgi:hypothetical protein
MERLAGWTFRTLNPGPGYVGAAAVEGKNGAIQQWQWSI